jgi:hypothetical protein
MKRTLYKYLLLLFLLIPFTRFTSSAQNLTGIWRGYFITEALDQYKFELQVKQTGDFVSGVSYSYLSTVFYGKATLTGNFNKDGQSALIREIKTVELRMTGGSNACIMKCIFQYDRSGKEEFLEGTFTSKFEKNGFGVKKGDDCGGGKVYLRKVTTSDFYIEPFLRSKIKNTPVIINQPPLKKDALKTKITTTPIKKTPLVNKSTTNKPVVKTNTPILKKSVVKTDSSISKINKPVIQKTDTTKSQPPVVKITTPKEIIPTPSVLKNRENELVKTLILNSQDVLIKIYDNGEIDDDSVSVYVDKKLILSNQRLTEKALIIKLKMEDDGSEHEVEMVALNLGRIPPNTSLMIVEAGDQRFMVHISTTEQKNAIVRLKYKQPK